MAYQLPDDPLGIGLRQRANAARQAYDAQNRELGKQHGQLVSFSNLGPLKDPMWDAFQQALSEHGVRKVEGGSLPMSQFGESTADKYQTGLRSYTDPLWGRSTASPEQTPYYAQSNRDAFGLRAGVSGKNLRDRRRELETHDIAEGRAAAAAQSLNRVTR